MNDKLRNARKAAKITQEDLATRIGVKRSVISKYENGTIEPSISQLKKIAAVYGISYIQLLPEEKREYFQAGFDLGVYGAERETYGLLIEKLEARGYSFSEEEEKIVKSLHSLNADGQQKAVERVQELTEIPKYQKEKE